MTTITNSHQSDKSKIDYLLFYVRSRIFHIYICTCIWRRNGLQNLDLCSALRSFEQGGIFIVPHLLFFFWSHPKGRPIQSPLTTHKEMWRTYSHLDPNGSINPRRNTKHKMRRNANGKSAWVITDPLYIPEVEYDILPHTCIPGVDDGEGDIILFVCCQHRCSIE
jgi:hypothetical protein